MSNAKVSKVKSLMSKVPDPRPSTFNLGPSAIGNGWVSMTMGLKLGLPNYSSAEFNIQLGLPLRSNESPESAMERTQDELEKFFPQNLEHEVMTLANQAEHLHKVVKGRA